MINKNGTNYELNIYKTTIMAKATKTAAPKSAAAKRTNIAPNGDKRYIRRNDKVQITESDDVGKSLSQDAKQHATKVVKPGQGDKGDVTAKKVAKKKG